MRLVDPDDPLVSDAMLLEDTLKVLAEIEGPTGPLRELLEKLGEPQTPKVRLDLTQEAEDELSHLIEALSEEHEPRGFRRDLDYLDFLIAELKERALEEKEGKLRKRSAPFSFGGEPPKAEMDEG